MNGNIFQIKGFVKLQELLILGCILIILILRFHLLYLININWDEYTFLSVIYAYNNGALGNPFFSFHVHFFDWLPLVSNNEIVQIFTARVVIYFLQLGSCIFIYLIGRIFLSRPPALFSVLCYLSISNIIEHGTSFRFDPICVFLFLPSIYIILKRPKSIIFTVIIGMFMALSLMISIKAIIHVFTILTVFLLLLIISKNNRKVITDLIIFLITILTGFFLLYLYHSQTLKIAKHIGNFNQLPNVATKVLEIGSFVPRRIDLLFSIFENFLIWFFIVSGIIITCYKIIISEDRVENIYVLILSFAVPLLSLIFYKFAYPYFYVFMLSLPIIFCGVYLETLYENVRRSRSSISIVLIIISIVFVFINYLIYFNKNSFDQNESQKEIVETVHKTFPNSVSYIDRCSMISSYPKVGFQMTAFDLEQYIKANTPIMKNILFRDEPVFLIANIGLLDLSSPKEKARTIGNYSLLEEDFTTLKANFVYHWGRLYVAGKHFNFGTNEKPQEFEILIPGNYTIEAGTEILINGTVYQPGDKVYLGKQRYAITSRTIPLEVTLRWGENLSKPAYDPSNQPIFFGFYWRRGVLP